MTGYGAHLAWNPERPDVLALGGAIHLRIFDLGREPAERKLPFEGGIIRDVDWIHDGSTLLVTTTDGTTGSTFLVDLDDGDRIRGGPSLGPADPLDVDVAPDGRSVAFAFSSGEVRVLDVDGWSVVASLQGHVNRVRSVAYSPDGARIATGGGDRTVRFWEATTGRLAATLHLETQVRVVAWARGGSQLAIVGDDTSLRILNALEGAASAR